MPDNLDYMVYHWATKLDDHRQGVRAVTTLRNIFVLTVVILGAGSAENFHSGNFQPLTCESTPNCPQVTERCIHTTCGLKQTDEDRYSMQYVHPQTGAYYHLQSVSPDDSVDYTMVAPHMHSWHRTLKPRMPWRDFG